jgi:Trypsin-co-occurring domain 1
LALVEFPLEAGGTVVVQVEQDASQLPVTRGGLSVQDAVERADEKFEAALSTVRTVAQGVLAQLAGLTVRPDTVTVEFGVELTGKAGAILVASAASAHLKVSLTWNPGATT